MKTHKELIEELEKQIAECLYDYDCYPHSDKQAKEVIKMILPFIDTVLKGERERVKELLQDNIWPGELNEHTNLVLNSIKEALTPLNKE